MALPPVSQRVALLTDKSLPEETGIEKPKPLARSTYWNVLLNTGWINILLVVASPGKLKHNLNINVGALLPGAAPVIPKILVDKSSVDETDETPKPVVMRSAKPGPAVRPKSDIITTSSSFVGVGDTEVLQSVTKVIFDDDNYTLWFV